MNSVGTNYLQTEYEELLKEPSARPLADAEARMLINKEFGFEASRIEVHTDAIVADGLDLLPSSRLRKQSVVTFRQNFGNIHFDTSQLH